MRINMNTMTITEVYRYYQQLQDLDEGHHLLGLADSETGVIDDKALLEQYPKSGGIIGAIRLYESDLINAVEEVSETQRRESELESSTNDKLPF